MSHCVCDREYDSDSGTTYDYICDWCRCDHTSECLCHAAEINRLKEFYYEMYVMGDVHDTLSRLYDFVQESPDFINSHAPMLGVIIDRLIQENGQ